MYIQSNMITTPNSQTRLVMLDAEKVYQMLLVPGGSGKMST